MNKRLFFLKCDGWFEEDLSDKLAHASHEELVLWAYSMMERKNYRNYLITENPVPSLRARFTGRSNLLAQAEPAQAPQHNSIPFHTHRLLRRQNHSLKTGAYYQPPRNDGQCI